MSVGRMVSWGGSDGGQCPAVYVADEVDGVEEAGVERGGFIIQGVKLSSEAKASLDQVADHEDAVWVPRSLLLEDLPKLLRLLADADR